MFGRGAVSELVAGRGVHLGALTGVLADRYGDRILVEEEAGTPGLPEASVRTARDLETAVARLAAALRAAGHGADDRVLVLVDNRFDVVLVALALARLGAVAVPVNPRLRANEIAAVVGATGARAVVADDDVAAALRDDRRLGTLAWTRTGAGGGDRDGTPAGGGSSTDAGDETLAAGLAAAPVAAIGPVDRDPEATALLLTTSGTTGTPKAAALSSRGILSATGRLVAAPVGWSRGPRAGRDLVLAALPLTHVMGFSVALACLCAGVPLLHRERFHAGEVLDLVARRRPNVFVGVPTMYADLEDAGAADRDLSSVQLWVSSADVMPLDRARRFQRYGAAGRPAGRPVGNATFVDVYGMVELSGAAAVKVLLPTPSTRVDLPPLAVVLPGTEVRAVDPDGRPVPRGREGELQFRGTSVLAGYEGRPGAGPDDTGWFSTGDHGRLLPGGMFQFSGRSRDRIKVGGFSVFPAEVETELREHPEVRDVALVGVPDDRLGERPVALVLPAGEGFDGDAWLDWARDAVAGYRRPSDVVVVEELPRGPNGKLDRAAATRTAVDALETPA